MRADPASHGFGITNILPLACSARKSSPFSDCDGIPRATLRRAVYSNPQSRAVFGHGVNPRFA